MIYNYINLHKGVMTDKENGQVINYRQLNVLQDNGQVKTLKVHKDFNELDLAEIKPMQKINVAFGIGFQNTAVVEKIEKAN